MCARYTLHHDGTLSYIEDTLSRSLTFKDVFLLGRARDEAKTKAYALRMELVKKRKVDKGTTAETWTLPKTRCEMNTLWDFIIHKIDVSQELDAEFKFPTIH